MIKLKRAGKALLIVLAVVVTVMVLYFAIWVVIAGILLALGILLYKVQNKKEPPPDVSQRREAKAQAFAKQHWKQ